MPMTNKLILPAESRMQGDLHVRFGGRPWETYHRKVARRPLPSLQDRSMLIPFFEQKQGGGARLTQGFGGKYYPKQTA